MRRTTSRTMRRAGIPDGYSVITPGTTYRPNRRGDPSAARVAWGAYVCAEYVRRVRNGEPAAPYETEEAFAERWRREHQIGRLPCGS